MSDPGPVSGVRQEGGGVKRENIVARALKGAIAETPKGERKTADYSIPFRAVVELCSRCRVHLIHRRGVDGQPYCYQCGEVGVPGVQYVMGGVARRLSAAELKVCLTQAEKAR